MSPRRIPTKAELLRLQKLYRTDRRIAEVFGNDTTEHLVAYWRRKKGIPRYSFPKFSEKEIREVWDRFGDDFHAGMELGISKAAFYNWRRRYKITKKPEALKLEQLSLQLHTPDKLRHKLTGAGRQTIAQKILTQRTGFDRTAVGDALAVEPDMVVAPATTGQVLEHFMQTGMSYVWNSARIVIPLDGSLSGDAQEAATLRKTMRDFARRQQIRNLFDVGEGNPQQVVIERGLILPGQLGLGCDHRTAALGAVGALALAVEAEAMSRVWATGRVDLVVPESIHVVITGRPPRGVLVRDIVQYVVSQLSGAGTAGRVVEFYGTGVEQMSVSERIALCCVSSAVGATAAVCPFDATTRRYVNPRARRPFTPVAADRNAHYAAEYTFDVNTMRPVAAGPDKVDVITPVDQLDGIPIQQVFLGGLSSGRFDDLKVAADILKGKRVNPEVRCIIQPASRAVYLETLKKGILRVFVEAGAIILNPGSPLMGERMPLLAPEETGLTTWFGPISDSVGGQVYQVSPATAAASALTGQITNPSGYVRI